MPGELVQNANGKWIISGLTRENVTKTGKPVPQDISFSAVYTYKKQPNDKVVTTISRIPQDIQTNWVTQVGVPISLSEISRIYGSTTIQDQETGEYITYKGYDKFYQKNVYPVPSTLELSVEPTTIGATSTIISYSLTANSPTTVVCNGVNSSYTARTNYSAAGTYAGTFIIPQNTSEVQRIFEVTAHAINNPEISSTKQVTQEVLDMSISVSTPQSEIPASDTAISYTVTVLPSNLNVLVKCNNQTRTTKTGTINIPQNTTFSPVIYTITASCRDYPSKTATTTVTQAATGYSFDIEPNAFTGNSAFDATGGSKTMRIINPQGYFWQIVNLPEWLTVNQLTGRTSLSVTFTAQENEGSERSGELVLLDLSNDKQATIPYEQKSPLLTPEVQSFDISFESDPTASTMADIGKNGGKIKLTAQTLPEGHTISVNNLPEWITVDPSSTSQNWVGKVSENSGVDERSCELTGTVTTNEDPNYAGTATITSSWTVTQAGNSGLPSPTINSSGVSYESYGPPAPSNPILTVYYDGYIGDASELWFGLATANTTSAIVASGYTVGSDVEEICSYTLPSTGTSLYLFYKANVSATINMGIADSGGYSSINYQAWLGTTGNQPRPISVTTSWNNNGAGVTGWQNNMHHVCTIFGVA